MTDALPVPKIASKTGPAGTFGIEAIGMTKRFGDLVALDNVSMKVHAGSFHALLGENGAGKSTLVKCMMGYYRPDDGELLVGEHQQIVESPKAAHALGLGMVYQHFTLVPNMTVAENLVLSRADLPAVIDWRKERAGLEAFLGRMPFRVRLDVPVAALAAGEKQKTEILKQLYLERRFLILDEPTSVLTREEADEMLGMLHAMTRAKQLTVLMITHKFREVLAFADEVTVLRRGKYAGAGQIKDLTPDAMAEMMIGSQKLLEPARRTEHAFGEPRLEMLDVHALNDSAQSAVNGVSLSVRAGEIVGIAGVSGNGQRELVEVLAGQRDATAGALRVHGKPFTTSRDEVHEHQLSLLPEEPLRNACAARMSIAENMLLRDFDRSPNSAGGWWLRPGVMRAAAQKLIERYRVKTPSADAPIGTLSGGNVQRAVLARELGGDVNVLIAANPVFGLDFAAVADIHGQIMQARNRGAAVLLVSEDLDELLELADRVVVMFGGRLVYETPTADANLTVIGRHMAGGGATGGAGH